MIAYKFDDLQTAPLIIDAIYKGGITTKMGDEPLSKLLPKCANQGGFRVVKRKDNSKLPAYIVLYTSLEALEWPDSFDAENGLMRYYGDNRTPGTDLHETPRRGNRYLRDIFSWIDDEALRNNIPPFLIFRKTGKAFDVQFLGVAVPGNPNIPPDNELMAIWRTKSGKRFQNYEAHFTIINTGENAISRQWLNMLINDHSNNLAVAPKAWKGFIDKGRQGITALLAPKQAVVPNKNDQLPTLKDDQLLIEKIRENYKNNPYGFELCATSIVQMMDNNFYQFDLTRPWRDGGRDALGKYRIGDNHNPLLVECALEAKCYQQDKSIGVRSTSRLISRIKYRQFGILVTTSYVDKQAYSEIVDDGHPILIVNARDISHILRVNGINAGNIGTWLQEIDDNNN